MSKEKKTRVILVAVLAALIAGSALWLALPKKAREGRRVAVIAVDGAEWKRIDLDTAADQTFSIREETGKDIELQIKDGAIRFLSSDCPDKICVNTGFLREDNDVAVCLPNRVAVTVIVE